MKKLPVLQSPLPSLSELCNPWHTSDCFWLYHWHPQEEKPVGYSLDCKRLSSFSVTTVTGASASHVSRECVRLANKCLHRSQRTVAYFFHPLPFLSYAGCYMGRRLRCLTQLQSLLRWWIFPCLSAEPSNYSAKAPWASGEVFSSCRSLLLQASVHGHYWLDSLLCMPVKEFLAVGCESTAECAWKQPSSSFSAFLMLSSSLTASCNSATRHTKWGPVFLLPPHSWLLAALSVDGIVPKTGQNQKLPSNIF